MLRLKYSFVNESKKFLDKLPQGMRFVGKPELLSDTFLETKLDSIVSKSSRVTTLTTKDIYQLLPDTFILQPGETRVGLFAIKLKDMT